jgi:hypothetical protein
MSELSPLLLFTPYFSHRWAGFLLMNIGEAGNFISYAYAPASAVAPLGTVHSIIYPLFETIT